ncbi:MAG: lysophospholipid acyltransferase family protein [Synergistaceae bacterium]|nr:lysophospholipid acyltransferase family protein [Synergistaceae bacterium]
MKVAARAIEALRAAARPGWRASSLAFFLSGVLRTFRPRGERILSNLAMVYPESTEAWRRDLRRRLYGHLGWMVTEILALQRDPAQALSWVEEVRGVRTIEASLEEKKGTLFVSAHYGNWELLAAWYAQYLKNQSLKDKPRNYYIVSQNTRDRDIAALIERYRRNADIKLLPKQTPPLEIVKLLKSGGHIALLSDIAWQGGIVLPFMGHDCTHATGPAILATLASVPVVPITIYRKGPFRHVVEVFPPLPVPEEKDRLRRLSLLTSSIGAAVEAMIAPQPELWFWLHNRWKNAKVRKQ